MAVPEARVRPSKEEAPRSKKRSSILGSLREAIRKVRFLLSFSATRWMLLTSAAPPRPQLRPAPGAARPRRRGRRRVAGGQLPDVQVREHGDGDHEDPVAGQQRGVAGGPEEDVVVVQRPVAGVLGRER